MKPPPARSEAPSLALCLVCGASLDDDESAGWQRGVCTCTGEPCPTGAVWLCPEHRLDAQEAA